jgi:cytochrome c biogenesis protein CcdA
MFWKKNISQWLMFSVFVAISVFFVVAIPRTLADNKVTIEVLERADCTHCQNEQAFLNDLQKQRSDIDVNFLDIADAKNLELFQQVASKADLSQSTPITIVGMSIIQGFNTPETTGKTLENLIQKNINISVQGFDAYLKADKATIDEARQDGATCADGTICSPDKPTLLVSVPFMGTVDVAKYSLIALSSVLGLLDGFNPCAMWVLVTFLIVLMQIGSRKKMFAIAGIFILAESIMYYLILNVWFKTWNFIGLDRIVTPIIGGLAIAGGIFFLYEWFKSLKTEMACQIIDMENRSKIVKKIKAFSEAPLTIVSALGIMGLAFSVNIIEFACSIGYPQAFTKIIQINDLGFWQTQWYMAVYIFFYMIDDLLVFGLALWGFDKMHLTQGFSKWSALIGGVAMLVLGYLLIFAPEILKSLS